MIESEDIDCGLIATQDIAIKVANRVQIVIEAKMNVKQIISSILTELTYMTYHDNTHALYETNRFCLL